jgi:ribosomal protein S12 methylthiotransferase accessory factor
MASVTSTPSGSPATPAPASPMEGRRYRLAPGVDVVRLPGGDLLLRSDTAAARVQDRTAGLLADRVLPLLDGRRTVHEVAAALDGVGAEGLRSSLDQLVAAGVLRGDDRPGGAAAPGPFLAFLEEIGVDRVEASARLARASVTVFGLEAHGAHLAAMLATAGVGRLLLADPFPLEPGDLELMPPMAGGVEAARAGRARDQAVREALAAVATGEVLTPAAAGPERTPSRAWVARLAAGSGLLAGCFDRGLAAANAWINEASLAAGVPAVFAELRTHVARCGPLVVPGVTACYLCWRMRGVACQDDPAEALAHEEHLHRTRRPALAARPVVPFLAPHAAATLALEAMKVLAADLSPSLAGAVVELDGLTLATRRHRVLARPGCPACGGPPRPAAALATRARPTATTRIAPAHRAVAADAARAPDLRPELVGPLCGLVRELRSIPLDPCEPPGVHLAAATLADHSFGTGPRVDPAGGKGFTRSEAEAAALGEAVERYAASLPPPGPVTVCRRDRLAGPSLDPRELVLYAEHQYAALPFARYGPDTALGWVRARSASSGGEVWVPAAAASMGYLPRRRAEWLFDPTSNGTAAGRTLEEAVERAALEVIERDAFLLTWLNRLPAARVDPDGHPEPAVRGLVRSYRRRGVSIELYRLPADGLAHAFLALAVREGDPRAGRMPGLARAGPAAAVGLGAALEPAAAARGAVLEVAQVRSSLTGVMASRAGRYRIAELEDDPRRTTDARDHGLLYAGGRTLDRFDFLRSAATVPFEWDGGAGRSPAGERLERLAADLGRRGFDLLYVDLTPPDVAPLGLRVARTLIPRYQPLHFGWGRARLGGTRLFDLPVEMGLLERPRRAWELNDDPHPLP